MRKIIVGAQVSMDGVMQAPRGTPSGDSWTLEFFAPGNVGTIVAAAQVRA